MISRRFVRSCLLASILALSAATGLAQQHATIERGFRPEKSFQIGDVDHINLLNGNLAVTIPIGSPYETNGGFRYGLTLVYNSSIWDFEEETNPPTGQTAAFPQRLANAGLGWQLTLGQLLSAANPINTTPDLWNYIAPDGSEHSFYKTLLPGQGATNGQKYSRDLSYLRLIDGSSINWDGRTGLLTERIEMPDGEKRTFANYGTDDWRLIKIEDPFGNSLTVEYNNAVCGDCWLLRDNYGRIHTVQFQNFAAQPSRAVSAVNLSGGRTYSFAYSTPTISRGCPSDSHALGTSVKVPRLGSVTQPDGSRWTMTYNQDLISGACSSLSGRLTALEVPTKGRIDWTYGKYPMTTSGTECQVKTWIQASTGVRQRTTTAPSPAGATVIGTWTYEPALSAGSLCNPPRERTTRVTGPLGHVEVNYFQVYRFGDPTGGWDAVDFGLPLTRLTADSQGGGRFLSRRIFDCPGGACPATPAREIYVAYEKDAVIPPVTTGPDDPNRNRRPVAERTYLNEDADPVFESYSGSTSSNWDGLGHYRQTNLDGNFGAGDSKTTSTTWNGSSGQVAPGVGDAWVLDTYSEQRTTEGSFTSVVQSCFDVGATAATRKGFLSRRRVLEGTAVGTHDLISIYTPDTAGNVISEEYRGGDLQNIGAGDFCNTMFSLPANQFRIDHTVSSTLRKSFYVTENGVAFAYRFQDEDLNSLTGEVIASRDSAELQTTYLYDTMGRLTRISPAMGQGGQVRYTYFLPTPAQPAVTPRVEIQRRDNAGTAVLAESKVEVDGLGRVARAFEKIPGAGFVSTDSKYDGAGNRISVSELGSPNKVTTSSSFDPFGRPGLITAPDGHATTFAYAGVRQVDRTVTIGTSFNSASGTVVESNAKTTETYDAQGRLWKVTEPSGTNSANTTTTYSYDDANRLRTVATTAGAVTQNRSFTYDGRGVMKSETHPEKGGASGNGTVTYSLFTSLGRATRRQDGPHDLTFSFDRAEHLVQVKNTSGGKLWKEFQYAANNSGSDLRRGKVIMAKRYNYPVLAGVEHPAIITENYTYAGRDGRVSLQTTSLTYDGNPGAMFTQAFTYDPLGNPSAINYPQCTHAPCSDATGRARTVIPSYTDGYLTSLAELVPSITYHSNGQVAQIVYGNGSKTIIANDPNGMRRPRSFQTLDVNGAPLWTTGNYVYDGTGNITKIGSQWFTYDKVSRLFAATQELGATGAGTVVSQTYAYDAFGNLQSISGNAGRTTPTSSSTNRLTSPGVNYDTAGNLTSWSGATYEYDALDRMWHMQNGAENWIYVYTPDDERIWSSKVGAGTDLWTLRDLDQKVLRDFSNHAGAWSVANDYLYRGSQLVAATTPTDPRYYHLDHLGTPRLITSSSRGFLGYHVYYPYGEEATNPNQFDGDRMKFTGHERDLGSAAGNGDDLDYMHARFCSPITGRFTGVDPGDSALRFRPQSWNRYAYGLGNPLRYNDPNGEEVREGAEAGVVVNNSTEVVWIAADVGDKDGKIAVIPLKPGESSSTFFGDADAVVIDPGTESTAGATFEASIEGHESGAFKIGISEVEVTNAGALNLNLDASAGYAGSYLFGRAGFLSAEEAKKRGWVIPLDRKDAEKKKEALRLQMAEREKQRAKERDEKKKAKPKTSPPSPK
ncbi:MAG TPA: RHS repeat-associated core domain-containing protein [Thermoanaerobaculia bacterium]|jgi:RHS repeat-associated protein|nr:RHS repeat-associated core domain-containing protein [Thermoanaerobaculia bacterium]